VNTVFADAAYWIALLLPRDHLHNAAVKASEQLGSSKVVTSEMVLTEVLNALGRFGPSVRAAAIEVVRTLETSSQAIVVRKRPVKARAACFDQGRVSGQAVRA